MPMYLRGYSFLDILSILRPLHAVELLSCQVRDRATIALTLLGEGQAGGEADAGASEMKGEQGEGPAAGETSST